MSTWTGWNINTNFLRVPVAHVTTKEELKNKVTEFAVQMTEPTDEITVTPSFE